MGLKSYIRGFANYPVDTRLMISATNTILAAATAFALANDTVTLALSNCDVQWTYYGSQVFVTVIYQTP